jgi:hypothetical protein
MPRKYKREITDKRDEVTRRAAQDAIKFQSSNNRDAYSVREFCWRHSISVQQYYKMKREGVRMPAEFRSGAHVLISKEAAEAWRRESEADEVARVRQAAAEAERVEGEAAEAERLREKEEEEAEEAS